MGDVSENLVLQHVGEDGGPLGPARRAQSPAFAEGDETKEAFTEPEEFHKALADMAEFYGDPPPSFATIGSDGTLQRFFRARPA